jgi:hypothetical protein
MKSGTRSKGRARYPASASRSAFLSAGYAWVAEQTAAEKDAIGNEPGKRACTFVSSGDDEREDEEGVEKEEGGDRNEEPGPDAHASSLVLVCADRRRHPAGGCTSWRSCTT